MLWLLLRIPLLVKVPLCLPLQSMSLSPHPRPLLVLLLLLQRLLLLRALARHLGLLKSGSYTKASQDGHEKDFQTKEDGSIYVRLNYFHSVHATTITISFRQLGYNDWKVRNPDGTDEEFNEYWRNLSSSTKRVSDFLSFSLILSHDFPILIEKYTEKAKKLVC